MFIFPLSNCIFYFQRFSQQELKDGKSHVTKLTDKWFQDIQASPLISDLTDSDDETVELNMRVESR